MTSGFSEAKSGQKYPESDKNLKLSKRYYIRLIKSVKMFGHFEEKCKHFHPFFRLAQGKIDY